MAEATDFKFGTQLGFAKAHHKITPVKKWAWPLARGAPKNFGVPYNISATAEASHFKFCMQLGLAKAHHKNHNERKKWLGLGLGKLPNIWSFPLIFLQRRAVLLALAELLVHLLCITYVIISLV